MSIQATFCCCLFKLLWHSLPLELPAAHGTTLARRLGEAARGAALLGEQKNRGDGAAPIKPTFIAVRRDTGAFLPGENDTRRVKGS